MSDSISPNRRWIRRQLIAGFGLAVVVPLLAAPGHADAAPGRYAKPSPPSPSVKVVPKPRTSTAAVPLDAPTVSFSQSSYDSRPGRELQVTAVASQDVGPTPYYISIYAQWSPSNGVGGSSGYVAICGSGTTCSATIRHDRIGMESYTAFISSYPDGFWPTGIQSYREADGYFYFGPLTLSASPPTVAVGGTSTLTASTDSDISPTIYYAEIYDTTTSTRVGECAAGTSCPVSVSQPQNTAHRYVAYLTDDRAGYPPAYPAATSGPAYVTWANSGIQVSLAISGQGPGVLSVTASASRNVAPYYFDIFDDKTGDRVGACAGGASCQATITAPPAGRAVSLVAFVANDSTSLPPINPQANSNMIITGFS